MTFLKHYTLPLLALLAIALAIPACKDGSDDTTAAKQVADYSYQVAFDWNEMFLATERYQAGYRPGPAPRALAYMGLSAYEACVPGMPKYNSMANLYAGLNIPAAQDAEYHWPTVVNASYAYLMPRFFEDATTAQKQTMATLAQANENKFKAEVSAEVFDRSKARGEAVAAAIWSWSVTDQIAHLHYRDPFSGYNWEDHYSKDGDWKPTFPGPGEGMYGDWGGVRTFAIKDANKLCRPPLPYSTSTTSDLYSQAIEVYAQNTPTLSYEDEWVGEFWSDDLVNLTFSPGPRWIAIGDQVLVKTNSTLETALEMNAKVGMGLNDANVGCWNSKYYYNIERPQTYINRVIDPNWKPALYNPMTGDEGLTPSFPAYPSGHGTMGAAGAETLAGIFGYAYSMTDYCHQYRTEFEGTPRTFGSFFEMAQENAWSRVPLGVHFRMDAEEAVRYGTEIGRIVNNLPWKK